jgi:hypothetical protein
VFGLFQQIKLDIYIAILKREREREREDITVAGNFI